MYLNFFENHLSYISNFNAYTTQFQCKTCHRHFSIIKHVKRHQRTCTGKTKRKFPGGFYSNPKSVFDKLDQFGIYVEEKDRFYEWFIVYDFEFILVPMKIKNNDNLEYTEHHVPISVSICSNVNEYTAPHCIIEPNADDLVKKMVTYMLTIAKNATELTRTKFSNVFEAL